jgi:hypothetical protein
MRKGNRFDKLFDLALAILFGIILGTYILKIQHFVYVEELKFLSIFSLGIIIFIIFLKYYKKAKHELIDLIELLIVFLLLIIELNKLIFFTKMIEIANLLFLATIIWLIISIFKSIMDESFLPKNYVKTTLFIGVGFMITDIYLRSKHIPFGTIFYIFGMIIIILGLVVSFNKQKVNENKGL